MIIWLLKALFLLVATLLVAATTFYILLRLLGRFFGLQVAHDSLMVTFLKKFFKPKK